MKKTAIIILAAFTFAACGGAEQKADSVDSTVVDSVVVEEAAADSVVEIQAADPVGGGSATHEQPIK